MTELIITPNYDKKTARFKGTIAGGESVKVIIVGAAKWLSSGLRLRVVCGCSKTVAIFPLKSEDGTVSSFEVVGDDLIAAPLELNTIQARLHTQVLAATTATFIVEDIEKNILYFQDSYELRGWVKRDGDEEPYDLNKFPKLIEDWRKQIENLIVDAKEVDGGIEVAICDGVSPAKTFTIRNGRDGQPGEPGRKGEDGKSLKFNDLTDAQKAELKGPKGDTGEGITDELKALPNKVTENTQAIEANRVAVNTEEIRAKGAEKELSTRIEESKANAAAAMSAASKAQDTADRTVTEIATLIGTDAGDKRKSARTIAAEEVAKVVANAPADLDTLKEIAAYIESDKTNAAQMVADIDANTKAVSAEVKRAQDAESELADRVKELEDAPSVEVDDTLTQDGSNPVKSSGIWSAIWGALVNIPSGFSSLYDWCVSQLAGKLGKSGGTLTGGITFEGEHFGIKFNNDHQTISFSNGNNIGQYGLLIDGKPVYYPSSSGTLALISDIPTPIAVADPASVTTTGKAADALKVKEALAKKRDITDMRVYERVVIPAVDQWEYVDSNGETIVLPLTSRTGNTSIYSNGDETGAYRITVDNLLASGGVFRVGVVTKILTGWVLVSTTPETSSEPITEVRSTASPVKVFRYRYAAESEEFVPTANVLLSGKEGERALPRYEFADAAIIGGVVTVAPYTNAKLVSDGTAFTVAVGGESGYTRDCVLRVECGNTVPTITWGANFHPRTDAETDFACVAGVRNVYWITEYAEGEFCVAGWQETTGGNAS